MALALIVALAENYCIGVNNQLPWRQSADLKHFKTITNNHAIIMGRNTFESIGKALPNRRNIVITHNNEYQALGCDVVHSLEQALALVINEYEVFIIGGAQIFEQALPLVNRMYLTWIHANIKGDCFFPNWQAADWHEITRQKHAKDEKNQYDYSFVTLERK
jgi:dihydrofolate reductase